MASLREIDIKLDGIGHLLSDRELMVPKYQRSYAWQEKHVLDLFKDIADAMRRNRAEIGSESEYFLGSIVAIPTSSENLEVADGQQRLATITIFIAAIRDYFLSVGQTVRVDDIEREYLIKRNIRTQETSARLQLNEIDHDFFFKLIIKPDASVPAPKATKQSHDRLIEAKTSAARQVHNLTRHTHTPDDVLIDWLMYLKNSAKIILVQVPDYANAFTIFETLNDRGLDLAVSDLLKNYLFGKSGDRVNEVQQRWTSMFGALEAVTDETIIVQYIRHMWSSMSGSTREKDLYTKIKNDVSSKQQAIDFATELDNSARIYAAILSANNEFWSVYGASALNDMMTLNKLGMVQLRPLLLSILTTFPTQADTPKAIEEIKKCLHLMVCWAVRFLIAGGLGGGSLEERYCLRAVEVRTGKIKTARDLALAMESSVPNDSAFKDAFEIARVTKPVLARIYLQGLEDWSEEGDQSKVVNPNVADINLEHILPQNPSLDWGHIEDEVARDFYNRIGNLALLGTRINSEIGNAGFNAKRAALAKSSFKLTSSIAESATWGTSEIEARQKKLAELAVKVWPIKI